MNTNKGHTLQKLISKRGYQRLILFSVFTWRHDRHVGAPKQRKGGHVGAPTKSSGNLTLLLCKRFLLFSVKNMAVDHVSENQQLLHPLKPLTLLVWEKKKRCEVMTSYQFKKEYYFYISPSFVGHYFSKMSLAPQTIKNYNRLTIKRRKNGDSESGSWSEAFIR